ncbi:MAG: efflux RND transporter periplasmic adaptor subunit, partial [Thermodesulfovibrionales bacterium]
MKKVYLSIIVAVAVSLLLLSFFKPFKNFKGIAGAGSRSDPAQTEKTVTVQQTEEPPTVEIPVEKQQLMGVKTMVVEPKQVQKSVRTVGRIEYDEKRVVTVNTKFEGWIEKLYIDYTGRYVKKGEAVAEIYSPELLATQMEFINLLN